ncbi:Predicted membrane protein [Serratia ficaria]|uniref:Predicted membrane protein n=1 Tax=Serratia ficaria TaxID=61651 RepID=A0A240B1J0_SERFI|nr:putative membrane protein [Serratia ficaria]CAI0956509.1 Predicted membrane protein [Serratia ficaria]CAI0989181.1 Predicted membrane protein [Serratia ficaria]CAI1164474.1 Predicted membrane protein [Serratia ficaria]CAI1191288.1 Predicted membrane protein [Serratia ficaria]
MKVAKPAVRLLQGLTWAALALYPLAVWLGLTRWGEAILAPLLAVVFTLRLVALRSRLRQQLWLGKALAWVGILLAFASWGLQQTHWLLYYPVLVNLLLLGLFASSLYSPPTVIERLARLTEPQLDAAGVAYTRRVTQVWCGFFTINGAVALATCLSGDIALWTLYNGGISYLLIGALMGIEWIVRKRIRRG